MDRGPQARRDLRTLHEETLRSERLEREIDRRTGRDAQLLDELLTGPRPVQQRKQRGQERFHRRALEDDDRLPVLEQQPLVVLDEPVPRRQERESRDRRHQPWKP